MKLKNKNVLITGADGFIGSHLAESLLAEGCHVRAFVYYNTNNSNGWLDSLPPQKLKQLEIIAGDIRDATRVREAIKGVEVVFHLAALIGIPYSYHAPDSYVQTNIAGTLHVVQAARDLGIRRVVITSTSEVYGTALYAPIDEEHPKQPQSPYAATKIAADALALSFHKSFSLPVIIARPFNTYGPRQSARAVIPTIIGQLLKEKNRIELGSLHPTRDLNYVADTCSGFIALASCDQAIGQEINIGSGREISIGDLAKHLRNRIYPRARIVSKDERKRPKESEVERLLCDNQRIRELTGWTPRHTLEQGLEKTVAWFSDKRNLARYKTEAYNI